jgi:hypothetical protein
MGQAVPGGLPPFVLDAILDRIDPHHRSPDAVADNTQQLCGRWLALYRSGNDLSQRVVAVTTGVSQELLVLLELGLATPRDWPPRTRDQLCQLLARRRHDVAWVAEIIAAATGNAHVPTMILDRVAADLELQIGGEMEKLERDPVVFAILHSLASAAGGESDVDAILDGVKRKHFLADIPSVSSLLMILQARGLIEEIEERADPRSGGELLPCFRITAEGRNIYEVEARRRNDSPPMTTFQPT